MKHLLILLLTLCNLPLFAQIDAYFYEYGGYDKQGNEQTVFFLTKTGYENLIVPTQNDTLVNILLQISENQNILKQENEALQNQLTALEKTLADLDIPIPKTLDSEVAYLRELQPSYSTLYSRYLKTKTTRNGFSMQQIDLHLGGDGKGTKKAMANRILEKL